MSGFFCQTPWLASYYSWQLISDSKAPLHTFQRLTTSVGASGLGTYVRLLKDIFGFSKAEIKCNFRAGICSSYSLVCSLYVHFFPFTCCCYQPSVSCSSTAGHEPLECCIARVKHCFSPRMIALFWSTVQRSIVCGPSRTVVILRPHGLLVINASFFGLELIRLLNFTGQLRLARLWGISKALG